MNERQGMPHESNRVRYTRVFRTLSHERRSSFQKRENIETVLAGCQYHLVKLLPILLTAPCCCVSARLFSPVRSKLPKLDELIVVVLLKSTDSGINGCSHVFSPTSRAVKDGSIRKRKDPSDSQLTMKPPQTDDHKPR